MTSQISKSIVIMIACLFMAVSNINAQQQQQQLPMAALIGQSLSKLQDYTPEKALTCIAELKRIDAMFPDSIQPKYQAALQSLYYAVQFPHAGQTESLLADVEQSIGKIGQMPNNDASDLCTLKGFLYMVRIVQDPAQNAARYYRDVLENYDKALKLNPDNQVAKDLQQKFMDGMQKAIGQ
jgi:tetratricopeptide (TPR) repeat protein